MHSIGNYRYQAYNSDGSLIPTQVNPATVNILSESNNIDEKKKYDSVFVGLGGYKRI